MGLIDAGLPGFAGAIKHAATERFGKNSRPAAILMTHGHFDHVGSLETLADDWDAPIYAQLLERPYLDGRSAYPPPDPGVGGGLMAMTSPLFPPVPSMWGDVCGFCRMIIQCHICMAGVGFTRPDTRPVTSAFGAKMIVRSLVGTRSLPRGRNLFTQRFSKNQRCTGRPCITHRIGTARVNRQSIGHTRAGIGCDRPRSCHARTGDARRIARVGAGLR